MDTKERIHTVYESKDVPFDSIELIDFHVDGPKPPHNTKDHEQIDLIRAEYNRVYHLVYGLYPNWSPDDASDSQGR